MVAKIFRIGAIIPLSGVSGLYGPSCKACIGLAQQELNKAGGIGGGRVEIVFIDGDRPAADIGRDVRTLLDAEFLDALVGMHNSDVRKAVANVNAGRVLYIYTPTFEGGHGAPGLICLGETPAQQIRPAMNWFRVSRDIKKWCFVGSDYSWPRQLRSYLESIAASDDFSINATYFIDPGTLEFSEYLDEIEERRPDGVFFALVGDEAVHFNREFAERTTLQNTIRFGPLLEENTLMAIGPGNTDKLYTSGAYFPSMQSPKNIHFKQEYLAHVGEDGPEINTLSVSSYAALHLLKEIVPENKPYCVSDVMKEIENKSFDSTIGILRFEKGYANREIFIAEAHDNQLEIIHSFGELIGH